jgi:beta-1,4-mannooligosaccharide/beta-1,4-mannosyl-N-acetylglucosamine phosphorylase
MIFERHPGGPILTRADIPDHPPEIIDASAVFNPGVTLWRDRIVALLRVQTRGRRTFLLRASSQDGLHFDIDPSPVVFEGLELVKGRIYHLYDARLTVIDDELLVCFAMDMADGCRLALARSRDFERFEFVGISNDDLRNGVLFPERIGGRYTRLERPNTVGDSLAGGGDAIRLAYSENLVDWNTGPEVLRGRPHYWDERIGSGPPPVKTPEGWLHIYHGVATHFGASSLYQAGVLLLDLDDPSKIIARGRDNILEPRESWELRGQVPGVVFPTGLIVREGVVDLYYGAADTSVGLARGSVDRLISACRIEE